jgi:hypothetical protein
MNAEKRFYQVSILLCLTLQATHIFGAERRAETGTNRAREREITAEILKITKAAGDASLKRAIALRYAARRLPQPQQDEANKSIKGVVESSCKKAQDDPIVGGDRIGVEGLLKRRDGKQKHLSECLSQLDTIKLKYSLSTQ